MDPARKEVIGNHRRFPSYIDGSTDLKKEFKKMSLDSSSAKDSLRSSKKSSSLETNINVKRNSKEESRGHQSTPSRREDSSQNTLKATPELLAQLLKGSSEKLVAEQHQLNKQKSGVSMALPTAVLKCLVSSFNYLNLNNYIFMRELITSIATKVFRPSSHSMQNIALRMLHAHQVSTRNVVFSL